MKVGFVGAGKVGFSLGRYLAEHGVELAGYASRSLDSACEAAEFAGGRAFATAAGLAAASDLVFLTVPDDAIGSAWLELADAARAGMFDLDGKIVCHCSGALSSEVLDGIAELGAFGYSVHPLFAINSKLESYRELARAPFTIEGAPECLDGVVSLFRALGNDVHVIEPGQKARYHAAAVMASNLVVGLVHMAAAELEKCGFAPGEAEAVLRPLFAANAVHIVEDGVADALTGPAARGDMATIARHLDVLEGDAREVYRIITDDLLEIARGGDA